MSKINNLSDFRKYNNFQISKALFKDAKCDPDIAVIMAWHIFNYEVPRNWSKYYSLTLTKWENISKWPTIPEKYLELIFKVYELNKYYNKKISLMRI